MSGIGPQGRHSGFAGLLLHGLQVTGVLEACDPPLEPTDERRRWCGLVICTLVVASETGGPGHCGQPCQPPW